MAHPAAERTTAHHLVHVWSGPRCLSTSLMYAWASRADAGCVADEPLYAAYLAATGAERPYRAAVLEAQDADGGRVVDALLSAAGSGGGGGGGKKVHYAKHMAKQRLGLPAGAWARLAAGAEHVLLVRDPAEVLASFSEVLPATLHETCLPALLELFSELRQARGGEPPPVVDATALRRDPEGVLRAMCAAVGVPFDAAMLSWEAGPRPGIDGVWAPWWYANTHRSTGFAPPPSGAPRPLAPEVARLAEDAAPLYAALARHQLRPLAPPSPERPLKRPRTKAGGTHAYEADARNAHVLVGMRDGVTGRFDLVPRAEARVSVLDSNFMLGDGVWEGIRLHGGVLAFGRRHLERLFEGAKALDMDLGLSPRELAELVYRTCDANGMRGSVHIRLMVSRGLKPTPYQDPRTTIGQPLIVILPEHKEASEGPKTRGIRLFTCHVRRGAADVQDPMWNSHSKLNCISACIQAAKAGADEGLMLDPHGFVATCNSVNFGLVRNGEVWAPTTKYQLHGITRENTLRVARDLGLVVRERDFTLTEVYSADEAFGTGTFGGQIPVVEVDGRCIGDGRIGPVTARLQAGYKALMDAEAAAGRALEQFPAARPLLRLPPRDDREEAK